MKTEGVRKLWDRYKYAALILLIGAGLLLWPGGSGHTAQTGQSEAPPAYTAAETLRKDLEEILGQIQGVGTVRVLLTVDTDGERQLAQNTELRYSGSATAPEDYSRTSEPVLLDGGDREETVVTRTAYPTYRGALVVCQGGDRADVKLAVTEGVRLDRTVQRPRHRGKMSVIIWRRKGPMSENTKRNIVVATMAVLVCAAVGLNWKYSTQEALQQAEEAGTKILGEATLVSGQEGTELAEDTVYEGDDYFASARLTRQQARDSAISLLEDAAKQEDADKEVANQASESIQVLASYTLKEAQIENLVTAKGYTDCVAFMGDDSLSIVVSTADGTLNSTDVAKITDIAMTETGYAASAIRIMASN